MSFLGVFAPNSKVYVKWSVTNQFGSNQSPTGLGSVQSYKDNNVVPRTGSEGLTTTVNFNGINGLCHLEIDLAGNSDGFYSVGHTYHMQWAGSVGGISVSQTVASFTIESPSSVSSSSGVPMSRVHLGM